MLPLLAQPFDASRLSLTGDARSCCRPGLSRRRQWRRDQERERENQRSEQARIVSLQAEGLRCRTVLG